MSKWRRASEWWWTAHTPAGGTPHTTATHLTAAMLPFETFMGRSFKAAWDYRPMPGQKIGIGPVRKFRRHRLAPVAFVQIPAPGHIFVIGQEGAVVSPAGVVAAGRAETRYTLDCSPIECGLPRFGNLPTLWVGTPFARITRSSPSTVIETEPRTFGVWLAGTGFSVPEDVVTVCLRVRGEP